MNGDALLPQHDTKQMNELVKYVEQRKCGAIKLNN